MVMLPFSVEILPTNDLFGGTGKDLQKFIYFLDNIASYTAHKKAQAIAQATIAGTPIPPSLS
jgi:hypothetical protein